MFRLSGWRLAALVSSSPLFQKSKTSSELTDALSSQTATRRVGTVLSFMHRRGYGFLRETELYTVKKGLKASATSTAGTPPTNSISNKGTESTGDTAGCSFFFPRASLDGGFYLTEGQTVSFDVRDVNPSQKLKVHLAAEESSVATTTTTTVENENDSPKSLSVAHRIRLYDTTTGKEKPVTPITLYGFVENWDSLAGTGVIAELDLSGSLHDDAPRFTVSLEDLDLAGRSELRRGRYVRFCLEPGDRTAARRVIIDRSAEQKHGVHRVGNTAENGDKNEKRHYGTVREVVEGRFGFVVLDETGESIFFHMSNAEGSVKPGDTVSFLLFEMTQGKHVGKKACMGVRRCMVKPSSSTNTTAGAGKNKNSSKKSKAAEEWDDDEFELLD